MRKKIILNKITNAQFVANLKSHPFENLSNIKIVDNFFNNSRGYVFKMPKPNTSVIMLVSGGLDSIITWGILLEKYHLKVYPLFLYRDAKRSFQEKKAIEFFTNYYSKKYPKQAFPLMKFSINLFPKEIAEVLRDKKNYYHPKRLLEMLAQEPDSSSGLLNLDLQDPQRVFPFLHLFYCLVYINYLQDHFLEKVTTVFTGVMTGDGTVVPSQSFTSLRNALLAACSVTNNYEIQYCSLAMEKELGFWFEKKDFIKIGHRMGLPLEKTWSCYESGKHQCGDRCLACQSRRLEFCSAGVEDKTTYLCDQKNWTKVINQFIKNIRSKLKNTFVLFKI